MRLLSWLLCAAAAIVPAITSEERSISRPKRDSSDKKIVCYYTNWSVYRPGTAKFTPQNINPYLCTHLIYAFGGLSKDNALKPFDKYQDIEQGGYAKFNGLKTYNKNLKTMLAIGGWNEGSARFSPLVADAERRRELVKNTVKFLRQNHFDGLDLDWEYPSFRDGGKPRDRDNYATLVQEFREEFERESEKTGRPRLLLTMAVPAGIEYIDKGYDVPKLNKYLDWMNILSYDYHSAFEPAINHHSPLFSLEEDDEYNFDAALNIDHTVQHYIKLGADKSKLVLGIPTYGRSYSLFNPDATDIGSPADGPGEQGEATREKGYLAYYEICERVSSGGWTLENPNPEAMGPYAYKGNQWVGFDDEDIVKIKAKYVNDNDLGGIMFWSIDNDDFRGKCHGKPYPLIEAAKEALLASANELVPSTRSGSSRSTLKKQEQETSKSKTRKTRLRSKSSTTTVSSETKSSGRTSTTPQPPTTPDPGSDFVCKDEGFFPHPRDCKKYFWCLDSGPSSLGIVAHQFTCPSGLVFNKISDSCDYARNVICKTKSESATTTTTTTTTTTARTTTVRNRLVITAAPPKPTSTTTTTTTESPEEDEVDEEEEEEDPGTIKELINLIKKLGGVEQLEKQLNLQNSDGKEKIKPSLYSRVLQGRTANRYRGVTGDTQSTTQKYVSVFRNRPVGPQSPSTEEISTSTRGSDKPRYVTIQRNRSTKKPPKVEETEDEEEVEEEEVEERPKPVQETPRSFRRRPNTDTTTEKDYVVLRRSRPQKEEEVSTPKYKNIVRIRSTTEAAVEKEDDEEEEEEIVEEEEEEETETEPVHKVKKYSSIIRDNKRVVAEEEEPKVSGPQGSRYENEVSSSTTDSVSDGRDYVNNVYTVTSPRYVEIRRTQATSTETTENTVHTVNNSHNNNREHIDEINEVYESQPEGRENTVSGFQRRITTDIVKRPTRPSFKSSTLASTTPVTIQTTNNDIKIPRFRERQQSTFTTETSSTFSTRPYKTLNRFAPENQIFGSQNEENRSPKQEKPFRTSTTTETSSDNDSPRRFQFAPRTKPAILSPKYPESTTEVFQISVPDIRSSEITEKNLMSPFPSATIEPTTPPMADSTILDTPQDSVVLTTFDQKPSTNQYIPTTSTQTSVVTSITESSFTERKRIFVPKKTRSQYDSKYSSDIFTTESTLETTKPFYRGTNRVRVTTPVAEGTTEGRKRRFKTKTPTPTTTTTEEPAPAKKYVAKKTRNFKRISSTEAPEVSSTTTERVRFQPKNKPRHTQGDLFEPSNVLQSRFNTARRNKIFSKKEEDDLEVQQTATFFDDLENNDKYIIGGALKQNSEKDFLNADVLFKTVPTVEEEEKLTEKQQDQELINPIKSNRIPDAVALEKDKTTERKELIRTKFINPALRNLRARTRQPAVVNSPTTEATSSKPPVIQTTNTRGINRNSLLTSGPSFRTFRGKTQQTNTDGTADNTVKEIDEIEKQSRLQKFRPKTKPTEDTENPKLEDSITEARFGTKTPSTTATTLNSNRVPNNRNFRTRARQEQIITEKPTFDSEAKETTETGNQELGNQIFRSNISRRVKIIRKPIDISNDIPVDGDKQNFRIGRTRTRVFKENAAGRQTNVTPTDFSTELKKSTFTGFSNQRQTSSSSGSSAGITVKPSTVSLKAQNLSNFITTKTDRPSISTKTYQAIEEDPTTIASTYGLKVGYSTESIHSATESPTTKTESTIRGTFITYAPKPLNSYSRTTEKATEQFSSTASRPSTTESVTINPSTFSSFRTRPRQSSTSAITAQTEKTISNRVLRTRGRVKAIDSIFQATEIGSINETAPALSSGRTVEYKDGRRVLVRRPAHPPSEVREEENELELPEDSGVEKTSSDKRVNQDYVTNFRSRVKSTTQSTVTTDRRRTQLDRRRLRGSTTSKPEIQTEAPLSSPKSNILLRRKLRPSTTTTTTTTTTEEPYVEQQEDSTLEESKALDEAPGIQDLADPAVVAIHNLATVSPGPIPSAVTSSLNPYSQTPASYTVHVTPSDIASFTTTGNLASVTPGTVSRPTSILTLKPYTVPLITRQYIAKQTPAPFRSAAPARETAVPLVAKEPYSPRSEILVQSRKQEPTQRIKPTPFITSTSQKDSATKSRRLKPFSKVPKQEVAQSASSSEPPVDYEYYDDDEDPLANIPASALKVKVHSDGYIECLDRGNFPHPFSCKKFISCAKMENNELLGWEYTCPKHLSFDPVGGICNWSAGLGCQH